MNDKIFFSHVFYAKEKRNRIDNRFMENIIFDIRHVPHHDDGFVWKSGEIASLLCAVLRMNSYFCYGM